MDKIEKGKIVLLKFPYTDNIGFKHRPAFVIKDFEDGDILVCRITSKIYTSRYDVYLDEWIKFGLKLPSVIRVHKIATLEKEMVEVTMGQVDEIILQKVNLLFMTIMD